MTPDFSVCTLQNLLSPFEIEAPEIHLKDLVLDSREVAIHKGFLAIAGHDRDGRDFIPQAVSLGAKVIISETDDPEQHGQMDMRKHSLIVHFHQLKRHISQLADRFFSSPTSQLNTIAVTGTNGKTSTVHFCCQLAELLGEKAWYVGTLGTGPIAKLQETKNTTPDPITMQRMAWQSRKLGCSNFVFEASSHALVQGRISQINTKVAIFTNLSRDHLDYHGTMEKYASAKRLLIEQPGLETVILNSNDREHQNWLANIPAGVNCILVGISDTGTEAHQYCYASQLQFGKFGIEFRLRSTWGDADVQIPVFGEFNVLNILCAVAAQLAVGHEFKHVTSALADIAPVAGRAEFFRQEHKPDIVVDYAHTPDALKLILQSLRAHCRGRLICVFGCGGDRDQGKRSQMGAAAEALADLIVLTNDNSRSEDPDYIIRQIRTGISKPEKVHVELNRQQAIKWAIDHASDSDLIVVAGKGHETSQVIGDEIARYDERQFIKSINYKQHSKVSS